MTVEAVLRPFKAVALFAPLLLLLVGVGAFAPAAGAAGGYTTYVACGEPNPQPSHVCERGERPAAIFESAVGDTTYEVCLFFPGGAELCAPNQVAVANTPYVNLITTNTLGVHFVVWKVNGVTVGEWSFRLVKPVRAPTIRRPTAERAARSLLREIRSWRKRSIGYYDCFGGKINRTTWSCEVGWIKGRRCFQGRVRVSGVVEEHEQLVGTQINYRRVC